MLVNATEMLKKAKAGHYAVGQFNINNLEWTKAILQTAQELNSPVILGVSEGAGKYMTGYKTVVGMVNGMMEELNITVPVALHLDHGSYDGCLKCVEAGFSSIMFDGSHYPIDENVAKTKELVKIVAEHNMSLEAEVGSIGGEEDGVVGMGECADPEECKRVADLGINFLAAGIGNIHGKYPANWQGLSFETLDAIQKLTGDIYYFRDAMGNPGLMTTYLLCVAIGAIIGAFSMRYIAKAISSRTTMIIAYAGMAVSLFLVYIFYGNAMTVIALMTLAQFFYGMAFAASPALYADTVAEKY